jgi:hypothetical protein
MIHNAIRILYTKACTINGDVEDNISVKDANGKDIEINWTNVQAKAKELQTKFTEDEQLKSTNKTSAITKLKKLGLTDDEITALIAN